MVSSTRIFDHPIKDDFLRLVQTEHLFEIYKVFREAGRMARDEYEYDDGDKDYQIQSGLPNTRLTKIYEKLHRLESKKQKIKVNKKSTSSNWKYPEIILCDKILLTVKSSDAPDILPEDSYYRKDDAKINPPDVQMSLFEDTDIFDNPEYLINGVITFKFKADGALDFLSIVFPKRNYKDILNFLDILDECKWFIENEHNAVHEARKTAKIKKENLRLKGG